MASNLVSRTTIIIIGVLAVGGAGYMIGSQSNIRELQAIERQQQTYFFNFTETGQQEVISLEGDPPYIILIRLAYRVPRQPGIGIPLVVLNATGVKSGAFLHQGLLFPTPIDVYYLYQEGNNNVRESTIITSLSEFTIQPENPPAEITIYVK